MLVLSPYSLAVFPTKRVCWTYARENGAYVSTRVKTRRIIQKKDRWWHVHARGCVVCDSSLRADYPSNRPDERRRRFFEGT